MMTKHDKEKKRKQIAVPEGSDLPGGPNFFADPVIGDSKEAFMEYCQDVLGLDPKMVGKWILEKFGKQPTWNGNIALKCLLHTYEKAYEAAGFDKIIAKSWAVPKICPLCGMKTSRSMFGAWLFSQGWHCLDDDSLSCHSTHGTWPVYAMKLQ